MIPYLDSINDADILAYWGQGSIFLQHKGVWNSYRLTNVDGDRCTVAAEPGLCDDAAPPRIDMTREDFFERCLLHRPPLGVVVDAENERLVHLSWVATGGDRVKAMVASQIHVLKLAPYKANKDTPPPDAFPSIQEDMQQWADTMVWARRRLEQRGVSPFTATAMARAYRPLAENPGLADAGRIGRQRFARLSDASLMALVRKFLNTPENSIADAIAEAKEHGSAPGPAGSWVKYSSTDKCFELYSGGTRLGRAAADGASKGVFTPIKYESKSKSASVALLTKNILSTTGRL